MHKIYINLQKFRQEKISAKFFAEFFSAEIGSPAEIFSTEIFRFLTFISQSFFGVKISFRRFSYIFTIPTFPTLPFPLSIFYTPVRMTRLKIPEKAEAQIPSLNPIFCLSIMRYSINCNVLS